jgi:hypothetical protein
MILRTSEKSNDNLDRTMMARFREFINSMELREIYLYGRLFTWSNGRETPTITKIDRAFVLIDWELNNPDSMLHAMSSLVSDHVPLHISMSAKFRPQKRFMFELFWLKLDGFEEAVKEGWVCEPTIIDPYLRLDNLFRNLARHLHGWGERRCGNVKL